MKPRVSLIEINKLKTHENVNSRKVNKLVKDISLKKRVINPVVADKKTFVILDGHHRLAALKRIGVKRVPIYLVNYKSEAVRVYLRRKKLLSQILKDQVLSMGKLRENFPIKTTRHFIKNRARNVNIKLERLLI